MSDDTATPPWVLAGMTEPEWKALSAKVRAERISAVRLNGQEPPPLTGWEPIDLVAARNRGDLPRPSLMTRIDGRSLAYRERTHQLQGESESGKTWVAAWAALQAVSAGQRVLWIDYEDDERSMAARLTALGANDAELTAITYLAPESPLQDAKGRFTPANTLLGELLAENYYDLTVIDGVTEAMTMEGLDLLDNADIASWQHRLPRRLARHGAAVVTIDHLTKTRDGNTRYAIGGQHKLAGITGAVYRLDVIRAFARAGTDEHTGIARLIVTKDRPGWVRSWSAKGDGAERHAATFTLTSYPDHAAIATLDPPDDTDLAPEPNMKIAGLILRFLRDYDGSSKNALELGVKGKTDAKRDTLVWLIDQQWVEVRKEGQTHRHYLTDAGRDEVPD